MPWDVDAGVMRSSEAPDMVGKTLKRVANTAGHAVAPLLRQGMTHVRASSFPVAVTVRACLHAVACEPQSADVMRPCAQSQSFALAMLERVCAAEIWCIDAAPVPACTCINRARIFDQTLLQARSPCVCMQKERMFETTRVANHEAYRALRPAERSAVEFSTGMDYGRFMTQVRVKLVLHDKKMSRSRVSTPMPNKDCGRSVTQARCAECLGLL